MKRFHKHYLNIKCLAFLDANNFSTNSFSIDKIANSFNLSCDIVDRIYDLINFNFEKLFSAEASVTGMVNKIR